MSIQLTRETLDGVFISSQGGHHRGGGWDIFMEHSRRQCLSSVLFPILSAPIDLPVLVVLWRFWAERLAWMQPCQMLGNKRGLSWRSCLWLLVSGPFKVVVAELLRTALHPSTPRCSPRYLELNDLLISVLDGTSLAGRKWAVTLFIRSPPKLLLGHLDGHRRAFAWHPMSSINTINTSTVFIAETAIARMQ